MYIYKVDKVNESNIDYYLDLYRTHFKNKEYGPDFACDSLKSYYDRELDLYFSIASTKKELVSAIGIIYDGDIFVFSHVVTHIKHRRKGLHRKVIQVGTDFIKDNFAPTKILAYLRSDINNRSVFEDLGYYGAAVYLEHLPEYDYKYELIVK